MEEKKNNHEVKAEEKYEPLKHRISAFDEYSIPVLTEMMQKNNEVAALTKQEEQVRVQLINLKKAIQDLELETECKIEDIIVPWGGFQRHLRKEEKSKFIQHHIDSFHTLENQYTSVVAQRKHREDEFAESLMRAIKILWKWTKASHKINDEELFEQAKQIKRIPVELVTTPESKFDELIKKANE